MHTKQPLLTPERCGSKTARVACKGKVPLEQQQILPNGGYSYNYPLEDYPVVLPSILLFPMLFKQSRKSLESEKSESEQVLGILVESNSVVAHLAKDIRVVIWKKACT